ncbi:hypothetical protein AJ80_04076 [Polytolypa hystricis UAMH7299]|uniref:Non-reducing polyketide synthase nscA n=1 Tax=Polytolypa hystricis (strain UAMH7299) TaxID=1447883 RepID=A0A2B7YE59_POLH7|nr:hypothetical protein AJ80_04076 [Polytolypa hystricis UAMH7299]
MSTSTPLTEDILRPYGADPIMPIAVIGMAGRYPADASNPGKLWDLISKSRSALTKVPKDRFNVDAFYHPHNERQGTTNARGGHFMERDVSAFDAPFFSITPNEAKAMDPQQRMALECTYEALENAGIRMEDVAGTKTSCYVGNFTRDYAEMMGSDREELPLYYGIGTGTAILSNRISWFFDLQGPSISIDTACSSSLVALHLGCQSLRTGEASMSIIGGTNLMLMPDVMSTMSSLHFLSPDSKCHSFDADANGYARGEGASFVVLKPLNAALKDRDVIRGVIRHTGVNQDGNTIGITVPSTKAQETLIRELYTEAGLSLANTQFVECHGTGTPTGDPLEASAIAETFGKARNPGDHVLIGSIKSNIGHLEGASGLAQVTKAIFALEKAEIPANLWFKKANPRIPMEKWNIKVPTELTPWPSKGPRRISINSFGYGGTNAHCIIDDAYHYLKARGLNGNHNTLRDYNEHSPASSSDDSGVEVSSQDSLSLNKLYHETPKLFVWTSNEQPGLDRIAKLYQTYLAQKLETLDPREEDSLFQKFAYTLAARRSVLPWKSFAVSSSVKELSEGLKSVMVKAIRSSKAPKLGFIFTGQGSQWWAMGRELCVHQPFQQSLEAASAYLVSIGSMWSLLGELIKDEKSSKINAAALSQPICTAIQVAVVDLLRHWGIKPAAVVGHSSGEIAAAYAKGAISRESAWAIAYHRGRLSGGIRGISPHIDGTMLVTMIGVEQTQPYVNRVTQGRATIACLNSPECVTLSGDVVALNELEAMLKADGHFARKLKVDTAYHSHHMSVIADLYLNSIKDCQPLSETDHTVKMFSSVTSKRIENSDLVPSYWVSNMVSQVNFLGAVKTLVSHSDDGKARSRVARSYVDIFVEVGPHAALQGPLKQILSAENSKFVNIPYLSILHRGKDAARTALDTIGRLFQHGYPINIRAVNNYQISKGKDSFLVDIPPFPWNHSNKYWAEPHVARNHRFKKHPRKDLFGAQILEGVPLEPRWRNVIRQSEIPWVEFHKVQGTIIYPAAGMMVMAIEAARQNADPTREVEGYELRDVLIRKAVVIPPDDSGTGTMLCFKPYRVGTRDLNAVWQEFTLFSRKEDTWETNCTGLVLVKYKSTEDTSLFADEDKANDDRLREIFLQGEKQCIRAVSSKNFYDHLTSIGLHYSGPFQNLIGVNKGTFKSLCTLKVADTKSLMPVHHEFDHVIHPATLDGIIQMGLPAATPIDEDLTIAHVPTSIERLYVSADIPNAPGSLLRGYAVAETIGFDNGEAGILVSTEEWSKPLVIFEHMKSTTLRAAEMGFAQAVNMRKLVTYLHWQEDINQLSQDRLRAMCTKTLSEIGEIDSTFVAELELGAFIYMKRVLNNISPGEASTFAPHLQKFYQFMRNTYKRVQDGEVIHQAQGVDWLNTSEEFERELLDRVSKSSTDGAVMCVHGEKLVAIMRGEVLPQEVLMKDNLLHNFYHSGVGCAQVYNQLSQYMDLCAHKNPTIKILEIGGGTGGTTQPILEQLGGRNGTSPRFANYTFTDISTGFFGKAQEKFKEWAPFMMYARLDISEDPLKQGFKAEEYDVVIAANVLHATPSMDVTMGNVKKLMKPSGVLVLNEITNPLLRVHMIVGSLSGWWLGEDDGREWGPSMTEGAWNDLLIRQGFSGVDISLPDIQDPKDHLYTLMVSTASQVKPTPIPKEILIVQPDTPSDELREFITLLTDNLRAAGADASVANLEQSAGYHASTKSCIFAVDCDNEKGVLPDVSPEDWGQLKIILKAPSVMWLTRGAIFSSESPFTNLMTGLARSARAENPSLALTTLDMDFNKPIATQTNVNNVINVLASGANSSDSAHPDWEYAIRDDTVMVSRILLEKGLNDLISTFAITPKAKPEPFKQPGRSLKLDIGQPGRLESLCFIDDHSCKEPLLDDDVEIEAKGVGLNFKDVMIAMGQLHGKALGVDCSGVVNRVGSAVTRFKPGDRVMTWKLGTFRSYIRSPEAMCQLIPASMDFGTAASLPVVYSTAYHALIDAARLEKGESILIHGATGGVGQAAIVLAHHIGTEVFATVSNKTKKDLLMEQYGIPEDHIFNSRSDSFAKGVMRMTNNRGVDVVLNSLAGEALRKSWHCTARYGRFIEMGQKDIVGNTGLDMAPFLRNLTFQSINLLDILEFNLPKASRIFQGVMDLINKDVTTPIKPTISLPFAQIEEGFRMMQTGKHMGKIVFEPTDNDIVPVIPAGLQQYMFDTNSTYVLSGGLGGIGRSLAQWMVDNGAKNLVFLSRSGMKRPEARETIDKLVQQGVKAAVYACDVGDAEQVKDAVRQCSEDFPPVKGVIQGAMVLRDAVYENITHEQWMGAVRPKVHGSWNLHKYLPKDLGFFVMLSSSAGIAGSRGQGNYSAGNTFQDALAHYRRLHNQHGASIDLGVILGVGFLANNTQDRITDNTKGWNFIGIHERELHALVQCAITGQSLNGHHVPTQIITGLGTGGIVHLAGEKFPWWFNDAKFTHIKQVDTHEAGWADNNSGGGGEDTAQLQSLLSQVSSLEDAVEIVTRALVRKLAKSMMVDVENIEAARNISSYGVDSLLAVEIRSWLFTELQADISVFDLLSNVPITQLARSVAVKSKCVPASVVEQEV